MEALQKLEKSLEGLFKDLPSLPASAKKSLVSVWPWIALVFGVIQLAVAWGLWRLMDTVQPYIDLTNQLSQYYGVTRVGYSSFDKTVIYLGIAVLVIDGIILLMAYSPLKKLQRRGWDLLFLGSVLNVLYAVVTIFIDGRGFGSFIGGLIGSAIGFYLLFQIKDAYKGKSSVAKPPVAG
jgi:hypothetical protein